MSTAFKRQNFFMSTNLIFSMKLSIFAKMVYLYLCKCSNNDNSTAFPSLATIADMCSCGVTKVKDAIKELEDTGLIKKNSRYKITKNHKMKQMSNLYTICDIPYDIKQEVNNKQFYANSPLSLHDSTQDAPQPQVEAQYDPNKDLYFKNTNNLNIPNQSVKTDASIRSEQKSPTDRQKIITSFETDKITLESIKNNCDLDKPHIYSHDRDEAEEIIKIFDFAIDNMFFSESIKVCKAIYPQWVVRKQLLKMNSAILKYAICKINGNTQEDNHIQNSVNYIVSCIYNSILEYEAESQVDPYVNQLKQSKRNWL